MAKDSKQRSRKVSRRSQATIARQAAVLADDETSKRWKLLVGAILLHRSQRVANASAMKTGDALDDAVSEQLSMCGCKRKDAPKLLCSLFACHGIAFLAFVTRYTQKRLTLMFTGHAPVNSDFKKRRIACSGTTFCSSAN